jgi:iron complex outermembrane receptor protein
VRRAAAALAIAIPIAINSAGPLQAAEPKLSDLADMTLEQLANIVVTSVSRQAERLSDAPASIFVITNDDIRHSGARTLAEALRLAPNLQVARTSSSAYAISARGFNNAIGNKLLVLIDGRTIYTPLFSGVFWDQQDVMLEDVERIEVISGPGATLWGANAVNGVINIITRSARDTQGVLAVAGGGNREAVTAARYGAALGESGSIRLYGKYRDADNTRNAAGADIADGWRLGQIGFRADWVLPTRGFTLQGDAYDGRGDDRGGTAGRIKASGTNVLARWTEKLPGGADLRVQTYYDRSDREDHAGFQGDVDTWDFEFQHSIPFASHKAIWGAGHRRSRDAVPATDPPVSIVFNPSSRTLRWTNVFVQDEIAVTDKLDFTLGIKLERNDYTGWETLPSARIAWKGAPNTLLWGAASRAVRAPARLDRDFSLVFTPVNFPFILGGPNFQAEIANVFELGWRAQPSDVLSYSITAYRQNYEKLRSGNPPPAFIENRISGFENGVEAWAAWQVLPAWRLSGGFSTLHQHLGVEPGSKDPTGPVALGNDPDYQWMLRSSLRLAERWDLDLMVRRVASLPVEAPAAAVPGYTAVDARLGWRASPSLELSVSAENLFDPQHAEFNTASRYRRSFFVKAAWRP